MLSTQPRPKAGVWVLKCSLFFCGVTNWHSWDADWLQVGNLETLIGSCTLYSDLMLLWSTCFFNGEAGNYGVLACQVGLFHVTLTQINSEMNCIAKNKCPESHKLDTRCRGENLNTTSDTCEEQQHVYFCIFCLWFIQEKCQKIFLPFWNKVLFRRMFVLLLERDWSVIQSYQDLIIIAILTFETQSSVHFIWPRRWIDCYLIEVARHLLRMMI